MGRKQLGGDHNEADCCSTGKDKIEKQDKGTEESLPPSMQAKVQDLDMSQLCRDFAEDFTQTLDHDKPSKGEDPPHTGFSPSACLSAMKRAKQKEKQTKEEACENRRCFSATEKSIIIKEDTVSDSGFQSAVADITHATTSFVPLSSENNSQSQSGFETITDRNQSFLPVNEEKQKAQFSHDLKETDGNLCQATKEGQMLDPDRKSESQKETTSTQPSSSVKGPVSNINCTFLSGQIIGSLPEKTPVSLPSMYPSGFKSASNKAIQISSANLERAKHLFENETVMTFIDQPTTCAQDTEEGFSLSHTAVKYPTSNSNQLLSSSEKNGDAICQLTASQKADVTELCTLLEEAESQFEFTQVKTAKLKRQYQDGVTPLQKADKEVDPDFLTGIDFDDSFNSDAEKLLETNVMPKNLISASDKTRINCEIMSNAVKNDNSSAEGKPSTSSDISEDRRIISPEPQTLDTEAHWEISNQENKSLLMPRVGFQTAGGNILRVSKKCLNKAKALFADLEANFRSDQTSMDKQSSGTDEQGQTMGIANDNATKMDSSHSGFCVVNDKGTSVSVKTVKEVGAFCKDSSNLESISEEHIKRIKPVNHKKNLQNCKNVQGIKEDVSEESRGFHEINAGPAAYDSDFVQPDVEIHSHRFKNATGLRNAASFSEDRSLDVEVLSSTSYTTSKSSGSSAINELSSGDGFCTASGKKVSVSADAVKKAQCLLNDVQSLGEIDKQLRPKGSALKASHLPNQTSISGGIQTGRTTSLLTSETSTIKQTHSKMPVCGPSQVNSGFFSGGGKPVGLSDEALSKAKARFSDIDAVSHKRNSDKKQDHAGKSDKIPCGFMTAGGAAVHVSQKNMLKAKNLLKEIEEGSILAVHVRDCDTVNSNSGKSVKYEKGVAHKPGQRASVKTGCVEFKNMDVGPVGNQENVLHYDDGKINGKPRSSGYSAFTEFSSRGGFCTASGKRVSVSDEAMTKAVSLLHESATFEDTNQKQMHNLDMMAPQNFGFQTASGKGVAISSVALKKAKVLLSECENVSDEREAPSPQPICSGFNETSSSKALKKAKALSGILDVGFSTEIPVVSDLRNNNKKEENAGKTVKIHCGFMTAGGAAVHVSEKNLIKAKNLLKEIEDGSDSAVSFFCDMMEGHSSMSVNCDNGGALVSGSCSPENDFSKFKPVQKLVFNTSADPGGGRSEFENTTVVVNHKNLLHCNDVEKNKTLKSTNGSSLHGNPCLMTKPLSSSLNPTSKSPDSFVFNQGRFCTGSGKKMSVSAEAMTETNSLSNKSAAFEGTNKNLKQKEDTLPLQNGGFQTASGKGVVISSAALKKAKTLLSECEDINDRIGEKPTLSMKPVSDPSPRNSGFHDATNQPAAFSSEGLYSCREKITIVTETRREKYNVAQNVAGKSCGFTTAGGAKVYVSQKSLTNAKNLLKEFDDGDCYDLNYSTSPQNTHKLGLSKVEDVKISSDSSLITDSKVNISVKECGPLVFVKETPQNCVLNQDKTLTKALKSKEIIATSDEDNSWTVSGGEVTSVSDGEVNQTNNGEGSKVKGPPESSFLILESLNFSHCTETQQEFFAQEALDCTKALLEDEGQTGRSPSTNVENMPYQDDPKSHNMPVEELKGRGKRSAEDADLTGKYLDYSFN